MTVAKIVYASLTGNTEEIADIVAEALEEKNIDVEINECTQVDAADFLEADICIVASYTYDDFELPDEIIDFHEELLELDLTGKVFGVVGSGDSFYTYFCQVVDQFDKAFISTGATKGADSVKVELAAEEDDIVSLEAFAQKLVETQASL
ncbi:MULTISPECIES: flavodoxin [Vagococcus]|uniref:Flavodoxin n=1 Tax=Vagococcus fluvialis bH819 TaxID=1255619 RepID=A0A1X6WLR2_9ENTE|nr:MULTISPECIES: flavodoxin [Vagococcus]SLM85264.1 Flavodoxin [Vagococcus fluvialis bH819]HCM89438.1 flavodoxin [Vagococcus sp.]